MKINQEKGLKMCEKALTETSEEIWEVEIVQGYAKGDPKLLHREPRKLDSVVLIRRLRVPAESPQEASDWGWAYIEAERIENAEVRWITRINPELDCVYAIAANKVVKDKEAPNFDED